MLNNLMKNKLLLIIGILAIVYGLWAVWSGYKTFYYQPSFKKQEKMVQNFIAFLQDEGIDTAKVKVERLIYDGKADNYIYIVKVEGEPYTYECYFALTNDPKNKELYCNIQEIALDKVQVLPESERPKEGASEQEFAEYDRKYAEAYKKLMDGLLLKKYLLHEVEGAFLEKPTATVVATPSPTDAIQTTPSSTEAPGQTSQAPQTQSITFKLKNIYIPTKVTKYETQIPANCRFVEKQTGRVVDAQKVYDTHELAMICDGHVLLTFVQAPETYNQKFDEATVIDTKYLGKIARVGVTKNGQKVYMYANADKIQLNKTCKVLDDSENLTDVQPPCGLAVITTSPTNGLKVTCYPRVADKDADIKTCDEIVKELKITDL